MTVAQESGTHFLNVDLDIHSRRDLQPLVNHFGTKVLVLFVGKVKGKYEAHLEIAGRCTARGCPPTTPDSTIRAFCRLVKDLPEPGRNVWDAALVRSFSVGVQTEIGSPTRDFQVRRETVKAVSEIGAEIVLTVYAPMRKRSRKQRA